MDHLASIKMKNLFYILKKQNNQLLGNLFNLR